VVAGTASSWTAGDPREVITQGAPGGLDRIVFSEKQRVERGWRAN